MNHSGVSAAPFDKPRERVRCPVAAEGPAADAVHVVDHVVVAATVADLRVEAKPFQHPLVPMRGPVAVGVNRTRVVHKILHMVVTTRTHNRRAGSEAGTAADADARSAAAGRNRNPDLAAADSKIESLAASAAIAEVATITAVAMIGGGLIGYGRESQSGNGGGENESFHIWWLSKASES